MLELFRKQAIEHQRQRLHGAIVLTRPASFTTLTVAACVAGAGVIAFLCLFSVNRTETASGVLLPDRGLLALIAPQAGVITEARARINQRVRAGDVLFVLSSEKVSTAGDTQLAISQLLDRRIELLQAEAVRLAQLGEQQQAVLEQRASGLTVQLQQIDEQTAVQRRRFKIAQSQYVSMKSLRSVQASSETETRQKEAESLEQESRVYGLQRAAAEVRGQLADVAAQRRSLPLSNAQEISQLYRQVDELRQRQAESAVQREVLVRAPRDGELVGVQVRAGQPVVAAAVLASLVPEGSRLQAELSVPSRAIGFVRPGTEVLLRYDAFPFQLFGLQRGTVVEIDNGGGAQSPDGRYRVMVSLESTTVRGGGRAYALQPRMKVDATLLMERRRLIEWVIDPLKKLGTRT